MRFVNCTPHKITVATPSGFVDIPPSGTVPRVVQDHDVIDVVNGIEVATVAYGPLTGLPPEEPGIGLIVSTMVVDAAERLSLRRHDLYTPDSGPSAIRENGQIKAVLRLFYRGAR